MMRETNKRPRRIPRTSDEVNHFLNLRKRREHIALTKLKQSTFYKLLNSWNVLCLFIYLELIFCYFGPCHYQTHYSYQVAARFGYDYQEQGKISISEIDLYALDGIVYTLVVDDFVEVPKKFTNLKVGKDFILQKPLKAIISTSSQTFRIFSASPVLFLSVFLSFVCFVAYHFNLNENIYSLCGLCSLNALTILSLLLF